MESPRTSRGDSNSNSSPEFEFWMVRNPSFPQPHQLTADQLFVDGVLLPLHHLSLQEPRPKPQESDPPPPQPQPQPETEPGPAAISAASSTGSKRWKDLFKVGGGEKRQSDEKEKKKERKGINGGGAEININIWPFSRSRSAGGGGGGGSSGRAKAAAMRKSSSAPCSRSNSRGERRWVASPGRAAGIPVGRSSPVWQIRRPAPAKAAKGRKGIEARVRVLNLNVNTCIGYRSPVGCSGDDKDRVTRGERNGGGGGSSGGIFSLRGLFSKKVY